MIKQVNFICEDLPTPEEIQEAIEYCKVKNCIARITYSYHNLVQHTMIDQSDLVDDIMVYIDYIREKC